MPDSNAIVPEMPLVPESVISCPVGEDVGLAIRRVWLALSPLRMPDIVRFPTPAPSIVTMLSDGFKTRGAEMVMAPLFVCEIREVVPVSVSVREASEARVSAFPAACAKLRRFARKPLVRSCVDVVLTPALAKRSSREEAPPGAGAVPSSQLLPSDQLPPAGLVQTSSCALAWRPSGVSIASVHAIR